MYVHTHWKLGSEGCMYTQWKLGSEGCMYTHWKLGSEGICKHILCCIAETNRTVQSNYTPINVS